MFSSFFFFHHKNLEGWNMIYSFESKKHRTGMLGNWLKRGILSTWPVLFLGMFSTIFSTKTKQVNNDQSKKEKLSTVKVHPCKRLSSTIGHVAVNKKMTRCQIILSSNHILSDTESWDVSKKWWKYSGTDCLHSLQCLFLYLIIYFESVPKRLFKLNCFYSFNNG